MAAEIQAAFLEMKTVEEVMKQFSIAKDTALKHRTIAFADQDIKELAKQYRREAFARNMEVLRAKRGSVDLGGVSAGNQLKAFENVLKLSGDLVEKVDVTHKGQMTFEQVEERVQTAMTKMGIAPSGKRDVA